MEIIWGKFSRNKFCAELEKIFEIFWVHLGNFSKIWTKMWGKYYEILKKNTVSFDEVSHSGSETFFFRGIRAPGRNPICYWECCFPGTFNSIFGRERFFFLKGEVTCLGERFLPPPPPQIIFHHYTYEILGMGE